MSPIPILLEIPLTMSHHPTATTPGSRHGFTLLELLVTMTIVAVLVAIALSFFGKARSAAAASVDAADMRSIYLAIQSYAGENGGNLPTTAGGAGPVYTKDAATLLYHIAPYLGRTNPQEGEFFPEFAAASWQSAVAANSTAPSLLTHHKVYTGPGNWTGNPMQPDPYIYTFGYPYGTAKRDPKKLVTVMTMATSAANSLMITEVDKLHPEFKSSKPSWLNDIPEVMAHGTYRLGLYWDGHVNKLDMNLIPL